MILERFYNRQLAHASYLIGCPASGEGIVIDANRQVEGYLDAAARHRLRIVAVTETHIHADYLSGSRELAARTGATLFLSDEGDADWKYAFADEANVRLVRHGDIIRAGGVRLEVAHTPGHTPEHISLLVFDEPAAAIPLGAFTGDFVFVGDVGRPDLLERAANYIGTMEKGARILFQSLSKFKTQPGHLMIWPAHGSGSACGKALGGVPVSTVAYEGAANWAFKVDTEGAFVSEVLSGQPEPPVYFKEMKRLNKVGPAPFASKPFPPRLSGDSIFEAIAADATVLDLRSAPEYAAGYIPGTLNVPMDESFVKWSGWLVPYDRPIYLLVADESVAREAVRNLALIGLDDVAGWFGLEALRTYEIRHETLPTTGQLSAESALAASQAGDVLLLDVRGQNEWNEGHAPGAIHIPLGYLPTRANELPAHRPIAVMCGGGTRSAIGASILKRHGFDVVSNVPGGFYEYKEKGLPVETVVPEKVGA